MASRQFIDEVIRARRWRRREESGAVRALVERCSCGRPPPACPAAGSLHGTLTAFDERPALARDISSSRARRMDRGRLRNTARKAIQEGESLAS